MRASRFLKNVGSLHFFIILLSSVVAPPSHAGLFASLQTNPEGTILQGVQKIEKFTYLDPTGWHSITFTNANKLSPTTLPPAALPPNRGFEYFIPNLDRNTIRSAKILFTENNEGYYPNQDLVAGVVFNTTSIDELRTPLIQIDLKVRENAAHQVVIQFNHPGYSTLSGSVLVTTTDPTQEAQRYHFLNDQFYTQDAQQNYDVQQGVHLDDQGDRSRQKIRIIQSTLQQAKTHLLIKMANSTPVHHRLRVDLQPDETLRKWSLNEVVEFHQDGSTHVSKILASSIYVNQARRQLPAAPHPTTEDEGAPQKVGVRKANEQFPHDDEDHNEDYNDDDNNDNAQLSQMDIATDQDRRSKTGSLKSTNFLERIDQAIRRKRTDLILDYFNHFKKHFKFLKDKQLKRKIRVNLLIHLLHNQSNDYAKLLFATLERLDPSQPDSLELLVRGYSSLVRIYSEEEEENQNYIQKLHELLHQDQPSTQLSHTVEIQAFIALINKRKTDDAWKPTLLQLLVEHEHELSDPVRIQAWTTVVLASKQDPNRENYLDSLVLALKTKKISVPDKFLAGWTSVVMCSQRHPKRREYLRNLNFVLESNQFEDEDKVIAGWTTLLIAAQQDHKLQTKAVATLLPLLRSKSIQDADKVLAAWTAIVTATQKDSKRNEYLANLLELLKSKKCNDDEKVLAAWTAVVMSVQHDSKRDEYLAALLSVLKSQEFEDKDKTVAAWTAVIMNSQKNTQQKEEARDALLKLLENKQNLNKDKELAAWTAILRTSKQDPKRDEYLNSLLSLLKSHPFEENDLVLSAWTTAVMISQQAEYVNPLLGVLKNQKNLDPDKVAAAWTVVVKSSQQNTEHAQYVQSLFSVLQSGLMKDADKEVAGWTTIVNTTHQDPKRPQYVTALRKVLETQPIFDADKKVTGWTAVVMSSQKDSNQSTYVSALISALHSEQPLDTDKKIGGWTAVVMNSQKDPNKKLYVNSLLLALETEKCLDFNKEIAGWIAVIQNSQNLFTQEYKATKSLLSRLKAGRFETHKFTNKQLRKKIAQAYSAILNAHPSYSCRIHSTKRNFDCLSCMEKANLQVDALKGLYNAIIDDEELLDLFKMQFLKISDLYERTLEMRRKIQDAVKGKRESDRTEFTEFDDKKRKKQ